MEAHSPSSEVAGRRSAPVSTIGAGAGKAVGGEDGDCNKKEDEGTKGGNRARRGCAGYGNSHADPLEIAD